MHGKRSNYVENKLKQDLSLCDNHKILFYDTSYTRSTLFTHNNQCVQPVKDECNIAIKNASYFFLPHVNTRVNWLWVGSSLRSHFNVNTSLHTLRGHMMRVLVWESPQQINSHAALSLCFTATTLRCYATGCSIWWFMCSRITERYVLLSNVCTFQF